VLVVNVLLKRVSTVAVCS